MDKVIINLNHYEVVEGSDPRLVFIAGKAIKAMKLYPAEVSFADITVLVDNKGRFVVWDDMVPNDASEFLDAIGIEPVTLVEFPCEAIVRCNECGAVFTESAIRVANDKEHCPECNKQEALMDILVSQSNNVSARP